MFIETTFAQFDAAETKTLKLYMLQVLVNSVLYNPALTLSIMGNRARAFLDKWFEAINTKGRLPRVHDKRLSLVALAALLELDPSQIPDGVKEGWPALVGGALKLFQEYPEAVKGMQPLRLYLYPFTLSP